MGTPPLSIASDTRRSSPRTPHQCRTLARVHNVCNTARQPRSAKGYSPAPQQGCSTTSPFLRR
nr:MAG TPA: hypothetical protein [Crassvirales sp.]